MPLDITQLEKALTEKDFGKVQQMIQGVADDKLTTQEQGSAYVGFAEVYLDVMNKINSDYKAVLQQAIAGMEKINKAQNRMGEKVRIAEVKASLNS